jgi:hypothetical protein
MTFTDALRPHAEEQGFDLTDFAEKERAFDEKLAELRAWLKKGRDIHPMGEERE